MKTKYSSIVLIIMVVFSLNAKAQNLNDYQPTFENIAYGPFERNVLDFWKAESVNPTPLVIFIHGGGFQGGDKNQARSGSDLNYLKRCLENKVSFAAINYRFKTTTRLDTIMLDVARALQFIRYKSSEWNINKNRIASYGGSAGGGASIWLAFNNDLADKQNPDPVLRESTRLRVVGHLTSQATYDFKRWSDVLGIPENNLESLVGNEPLTLYHIPNTVWYDSLEIIELRKKLDMISMLDKDDPPVYFSCGVPNKEPVSRNEVIHHPKHPIYLKRICDNLKIDNAINLVETPQSERVDMLDFFFKYILDSPTGITETDNLPAGYQLFQNYPNPFNPSTSISYQISEATHVTLKVFDLLGREVASLINQEMKAGKHEIKFNGTSLSSGIYIYQLMTANFVSAKKLILLK